MRILKVLAITMLVLSACAGVASAAPQPPGNNIVHPMPLSSPEYE